MGWADCGNDRRGRPIGYAFAARCDHAWGVQKCHARIDRGLAFACGGMHGDDEVSCEGYFCPDHLYYAEGPDGETHRVCRRCANRLRCWSTAAGRGES